jgi:type II secretory pathway component PulC
LSYAIVDSSVVKIGDVIGDYQVLKIEEDRVVFIKEGQIKEVLLKKED